MYTLHFSILEFGLVENGDGLGGHGEPGESLWYESKLCKTWEMAMKKYTADREHAG